MSKKETIDTTFQNDKDQLVQSIEQLMKNGEAFELIDGDNLEFKGLLIKEVVR